MKNRICLMAVFATLTEMLVPVLAKEKSGLQTPYAWMCTTPVDNEIDVNYVWKDVNGNKVELNVDGKEYVNNRNSIYTYNFYPSLSFAEDQNALLRLEGTGLQKATVIGVYGYHSETDHVEDGFVMNLSNGIVEDETAITKAKIVHSSSSSRKSFVYNSKNLKGAKPNGNNPKNNKETQKNLRIMSYTKSTNPRTTVSSTFSNIKIGGVFEDGKTALEGTYQETDFPEEAKAKRVMGVPELMVYDKALTDKDRQRTETYLALKYGITLDVDYLLDDVVWKKGNFTRICGYGRLDKYNFLQSQVTTSERETPFYLTDTYYKNSMLNKSAYENLLVAGCLGPIQDGSLVMFGDNDEPFELIEFDKREKSNIIGLPSDAVNFVQEEDQVEYVPIKRVWMVKRLEESYNQEIKEKLVLSDAQVTEVFAGSYDININENSSVKIENLPAFEKNGEISWIASSMSGSVTVTIGSHTYKFDSNGSISVDANVIDTKFKLDDMLEVVKNGTLFYVRRNGENIPSTRIKNNGDKSDWNMLLSSTNKKFEVGQFHYQSDDVFNDFVELSYDFDDSLSFYSNGNIYLIVSKELDFKADNVDLKIYKMSAKDRVRSKVLFDNLSWENGTSYFTFAVSGNPMFDIVDKKYIIEETMPNCVPPSSSATGKLVVTFPDDQKYAYLLERKYGDAVFRNSNVTNTATIDKISNGDYILYIAPFDDVYRFDIDGSSENPEIVSMKPSFNDNSRLSATWIVGDSKKYSLSGLTTTDRSKIVCGVQIEKGMIYKVENGNLDSDGISVKDGDVIKFAGAGHNKIKVYVNDAEAFNMDQNMDQRLFWSIKTVDGKTVRHISFEEMTITGCAPVAEYEYADHFISSEHLSLHEVGLFKYPVSMVCDGVGDEEEENILEESSSKNLIVTSSFNGTYMTTVRVTLPGEYWANLIIVDALGTSQYFSMPMISNVDEGIFQREISIKSPGIYTAIVNSQSGQLTGKFEIK